MDGKRGQSSDFLQYTNEKKIVAIPSEYPKFSAAANLASLARVNHAVQFVIQR